MNRDAAPPRWLPFVVLGIGLVAISFGAVLARFAQGFGLPSLAIAAMRLGFATLLITPVAVWRSRRVLLAMTRRQGLLALGAGFFLALHFATWISSLEYTSVASSTALVTTNLLWIGLASFFLFGDKPRPLMLVGMAIYTLWKKDFGKLHKPAVIGQRERWLAALIGGAIGFYDGIFGPGTGSFLIFLFIRFFAFDFLHASASAKFVNFATNLAALVFFVPAGHILLKFAVPMAACNVAGSLVGTRLALRGGAGFVRVLFLMLLAVLIGKFAYDMWGAA